MLTSEPSSSFMFLFGCSIVCNTLWPHGLQPARLPCPSLSPRVCSNSCPLNQRCHPTISSSVVPFSSCPQSLPASVSFRVSQLFVSGGQSIGVCASVSVLPVNIQGWSPSGWTGLICLLFKGLSRVFSCATVLKHQFFSSQPSYMTTGNTIALTRWTFAGKVLSLLFNKLSMLVIAFLPRSKQFLSSWIQSPSAVILKPKKIKSVIISIPPSIYFPWSDGTRCHDLSFLNVEF